MKRDQDAAALGETVRAFLINARRGGCLNEVELGSCTPARRHVINRCLLVASNLFSKSKNIV